MLPSHIHFTLVREDNHQEALMDAMTADGYKRVNVKLRVNILNHPPNVTHPPRKLCF